MTPTTPNKPAGTNHRAALPFEAAGQLEIASCVPPFLSAAIAHLWRPGLDRIYSHS